MDEGELILIGATAALILSVLGGFVALLVFGRPKKG